MISASRAPRSPSPDSRSRTIAFQSGILDSRNAPYRFCELQPTLPLRRQHLASRRRQPIKTPPPLPGFLHPAALNPTTPFEPVQQRIQGRHLKRERPLRTRRNQLADFIAMPRALFNQRQDQQLRAALFKFTLSHMYRYTTYVLPTDTLVIPYLSRRPI